SYAKNRVELKVLRRIYRSVQGCAERDGGIEYLGDRAGRLGLLGELEELVARNARHLAAHSQRDRRDAPAGAFLVHREIGPGLQFLRRMPGAAQPKRQRHRKAAGVRGRDQFLRIRALAVAESGRKRVRRIGKRAALGGERATAVLAGAAPGGGGASLDR